MRPCAQCDRIKDPSGVEPGDSSLLQSSKLTAITNGNAEREAMLEHDAGCPLLVLGLVDETGALYALVLSRLSRCIERST